MLNLDAFNLAEIQHCLHVLNECEGEGLTDIRFVRQRLQNHVYAKVLEKKVEAVQSGKKQMRPVQTFGYCPECGARQVVTTVVDGEQVMTCRRCRWGKYVGSIQSAGVE